MQAKSLAELSLQFRLSGWQSYTISWVLIHDYRPTDIQESKQILTANKFGRRSATNLHKLFLSKWEHFQIATFGELHKQKPLHIRPKGRLHPRYTDTLTGFSGFAHF